MSGEKRVLEALIGIRNTVEAQIFTIGHGNKSFEALVALLEKYGVEVLVDVRTYPRSKRNPHFDRENLEGALGRFGFSYTWLRGLGGFRKQGLGAQSPHVALKAGGFRNYADYMLTETFKENIGTLLREARKGKTCIMCAETRPFKCHRWYLSDYLCANQVPVMHIIDMEQSNWHKLSEYARIQDVNVIYDQLPPKQRNFGF
jgi:uncharacterized protein (DUF488 family)